MQKKRKIIKKIAHTQYDGEKENKITDSRCKWICDAFFSINFSVRFAYGFRLKVFYFAVI